jgi:hypothetical protein
MSTHDRLQKILTLSPQNTRSADRNQLSIAKLTRSRSCGAPAPSPGRPRPPAAPGAAPAGPRPALSSRRRGSTPAPPPTRRYKIRCGPFRIQRQVDVSPITILTVLPHTALWTYKRCITWKLTSLWKSLAMDLMCCLKASLSAKVVGLLPPCCDKQHTAFQHLIYDCTARSLQQSTCPTTAVAAESTGGLEIRRHCNSNCTVSTHIPERARIGLHYTEWRYTVHARAAMSPAPPGGCCCSAPRARGTARRCAGRMRHPQSSTR